MLYPEGVVKRLGLDKVIEELGSFCATEQGLIGVNGLDFLTVSRELELAHIELREYISRTSSGKPPFEETAGIIEIIDEMTSKGAFFEGEQLLQVRNIVNTGLAWNDFLSGKERSTLINSVIDWNEISQIGKILASSISDDGTVLDSASIELKQIRKKIAGQEGKVRKVAYGIFNELSKKGWVPDGSTLGIRNGRYVIPVGADRKKNVKGYIQDESSSGSISFVEPEEVVESSNQLMVLKQEEKREIYAILSSISKTLVTLADQVRMTAEWVGKLDLLNVKALFGAKYDMIIPQFDQAGNTVLKDCYHLQLYKSNKVDNRVTEPLSLKMDKHNRLIVISGPNAGGKSVALKTMGLAQLMFQYGLPVKTAEGSRMRIFDKLMVDIGDNQSIENDLSTYSSHLIVVKKCLEEANDNTLVLFDEFGSGTEPRIGGAISEVVLKRLNQKRSFGVITTHYVNIKELAEKEEGLCNASMLFDVDQMTPLYVLEMGKPGSSFAVEIARKTGINEGILKEASEISGVDLMDLDVMLSRLQQQTRDLELKQVEIDKLKVKLQSESTKYVDLKHELEGKKKDILKKATQEAEWILDGANKEIEKTIRHIKTSRAHKDETRKVRSKLEKRKQELVKRTGEVEKTKKVKQEISINDRVRIEGQISTGLVVKISKKDAEVLVGSITVKVKLEKLVLVEESKEGKIQQSIATKRGIDITQRKASFTNELNIRGMRAEEALIALDKYLDDALLLGTNSIRILHGKGDGILRGLVQKTLKNNSSIESFQDEHPDRGGTGLTIAYFK